MPQPKKQASSARKPTARKGPRARRPRVSPPPRMRRAAPPEARDGRQARRCERCARRRLRTTTTLRAAVASVRELLSHGVVITGDRLQEAVDDAVSAAA